MKLLVAACAMSLCACSSDLSSPFSAVAVTYDTTAQEFKLAQVRLNSLTSLRHLQGSAGNVTSGGTVQVRSAAVDQEAATVASLRLQFITGQPSEVDLTWNVLGSIVYAEDFASLELLSTYYNMEKARALVSSLGLDSLPAEPIVAHASIENEVGLSPLPQGEMFYAPLATFYPPDATPAEQVPAALNLGAVAHALGHEAVEDVVWAAAPTPAPELLGTDPDSLTAKHVERSFTEGVADYLGVAVSLDDAWFLHSLAQDAPARTLDQSRCGTPDMLDALTVDDSAPGSAPYDPYPLGSVIASVLWDEGTATTQQNTTRGLLAALPALGSIAAAGPLTLPIILDTIAANSPSDQQPDLCGMILNRFAPLGIQSSDLPSCTNTIPHSECQ